MLGPKMDKWPDEALRRVIDTPIENWGSGGVLGDTKYPSMNEPGRGCLYEVAAGEKGWARAVETLDHEEVYGFEGRNIGPTIFDRLVFRFGFERVVRAVKNRALNTLLARHPLEPAHRAEMAGV